MRCCRAASSSLACPAGACPLGLHAPAGARADLRLALLHQPLAGQAVLRQLSRRTRTAARQNTSNSDRKPKGNGKRISWDPKLTETAHCLLKEHGKELNQQASCALTDSQGC